MLTNLLQRMVHLLEDRHEVFLTGRQCPMDIRLKDWRLFLDFGVPIILEFKVMSILGCSIITRIPLNSFSLL